MAFIGDLFGKQLFVAFGGVFDIQYISASSGQPLNAYGPIEVTVPEIITDVSALQPEKV